MHWKVRTLILEEKLIESKNAPDLADIV